MICCPVCASTDTELHGDYRSKHGAFHGLTRRGCRSCGLAFADPMPDPEQLDAFNANYYEAAHGVDLSADPVQWYHSGINRIRLQHVLEYCRRRDLDPASVVEVGPGHGLFAGHVLKHRPETRYVAVESDSTCHPGLEAMGVSVATGFDAVAEGSFDLAVASHVLEHVADPTGFLGALRDRLVPGGVLFVEVPCRDHEHKDHDEPHVLFFDKPSMQRLLERLEMQDIELSWHGEEIRDLTSPTYRVRKKVGKVLARLGLAGGPGMPPGPLAEALTDDEWRTVASFQAHRTAPRPAWWLRAIARR